EVRQRCIGLGVPADGSYTQVNGQISVTTGGNRNLQPETSNSYNISLAYSPVALQDRPWIDSLDFELAYYDIRLSGAISAIAAQDQLDRCVIGNDSASCNGIVRNSLGTISSFDNALQNLGGINVRGFDLTVAYRTPRKPIGRFRAAWNSSYLLAYEEIVPSDKGFTTINRAGTIAGTPERAYPRFKSSLALGWLYKQLDVTLTTRYIHSLTEPCTDLTNYPQTCSDFKPVDADSTNH